MRSLEYESVRRLSDYTSGCGRVERGAFAQSGAFPQVLASIDRRPLTINPRLFHRKQNIYPSDVPMITQQESSHTVNLRQNSVDARIFPVALWQTPSPNTIPLTRIPSFFLLRIGLEILCGPHLDEAGEYSKSCHTALFRIS